MSRYLRLNLDELFQGDYYYTSFDVGGSGHSITIREEDREEFLEEFAQIWRERAEEILEVDDDFE